MNTAPTKHHRLAPSSSNRWLPCPGSAVDDLPESSNEASRAGNRGHEFAAVAIHTGLPIFKGSWEAEIVTPYVNFVRGMPGRKLHEQMIVSERIPDFGGTIDTIGLDYGLHVVDLKTGKWRVPAKNNTQLKCYLVLAREQFPKARKFLGTIVQPMAFVKPQTVEFSATELDAFADQVEAAGESDALNPGQHCRFCPLRPTCGTGQLFAESQGWPQL